MPTCSARSPETSTVPVTAARMPDRRMALGRATAPSSATKAMMGSPDGGCAVTSARDTCPAPEQKILAPRSVPWPSTCSPGGASVTQRPNR